MEKATSNNAKTDGRVGGVRYTLRQEVDGQFKKLGSTSRRTAQIVRVYAKPKGILARLGIQTRTP